MTSQTIPCRTQAVIIRLYAIDFHDFRRDVSQHGRKKDRRTDQIAENRGVGLFADLPRPAIADRASGFLPRGKSYCTCRLGRDALPHATRSCERPFGQPPNRSPDSESYGTGQLACWSARRRMKNTRSHMKPQGHQAGAARRRHPSRVLRVPCSRGPAPPEGGTPNAEDDRRPHSSGPIMARAIRRPPPTDADSPPTGRRGESSFALPDLHPEGCRALRSHTAILPSPALLKSED